jgi:glycosyltransferase involved in cell wall biosynthesis
MRFLLVSTHIDQITGYSKVSYNLINELSKTSHKVFHFGFQRNQAKANVRKYPQGVYSYDAEANEDPKEQGFGFNKIYEYIELVNPDVVMIYNDPLIINKFIESMKHDKATSTYKLWIYIDQVYTGIAKPLIDTIHTHADKIFCFSDIWKSRFSNYGDFPEVHVLEHGLDKSFFKISNTEQIKKKLNLPADAIVLLNANRNSQRKRLDLTLQGFSKIISKNPNAYLMMITNLKQGPYDIPTIWRNEVLPEYHNRLLLIDSSKGDMTDSMLNELYNIADIGVNTSDGEGYGLCQLEHLALGKPQVVTDIGTYRTFMNEEVAEFIPEADRLYLCSIVGLYSWTFKVEDVAYAMQKCIDTLDSKRKAISKLQFKDWTEVCEKFISSLGRV